MVVATGVTYSEGSIILADIIFQPNVANGNEKLCREMATRQCLTLFDLEPYLSKGFPPPPV